VIQAVDPPISAPKVSPSTKGPKVSPSPKVHVKISHATRPPKAAKSTKAPAPAKGPTGGGHKGPHGGGPSGPSGGGSGSGSGDEGGDTDGGHIFLVNAPLIHCLQIKMFITIKVHYYKHRHLLLYVRSFYLRTFELLMYFIPPAWTKVGLRFATSK